MIETFYEQIQTFGKLIKRDEIIERILVDEQYEYSDTKINVHIKQGKPIAIIVSK